MSAVSIVLLNQKGGVGKTSTCHHLAGTLAQAGKKILLVDNDPQASLTQGLFGPQATRDLDPSRDDRGGLLGRRRPRADHPPHGDRRHRPGARLAARHEVQQRGALGGRPRLAGRHPGRGRAVRERYDFILIDCPPNLHLC